MVIKISEMKDEPAWMRAFRLKAFDIFLKKPMPTWGDSGRLAEINFDDIHYFVRSAEKQGKTWDEVPDDIKRTFDRLGHPGG